MWKRGIQLSDGSKGKKKQNFLFMQESCDKEAVQNSLFFQRIQKAVEGEIPNK